MLELIKNKTYKQAEIRLSSQRFANKKDKSDGYETKVLVQPGIHPELESGLTYSHGTPRVVNKEVKEKIAKKEKPYGKLNFVAPVKIDGANYQILEVMNNKDRTKLFYWLRNKERYVICDSPYDKNYRDVRIIRSYEGEEAAEDSFANWTMQLNFLATTAKNPVGSDCIISTNA